MDDCSYFEFAKLRESVNNIVTLLPNVEQSLRNAKFPFETSITDTYAIMDGKIYTVKSLTDDFEMAELHCAQQNLIFVEPGKLFAPLLLQLQPKLSGFTFVNKEFWVNLNSNKRTKKPAYGGNRVAPTFWGPVYSSNNAIVFPNPIDAETPYALKVPSTLTNDSKFTFEAKQAMTNVKAHVMCQGNLPREYAARNAAKTAYLGDFEQYNDLSNFLDSLDMISDSVICNAGNFDSLEVLALAEPTNMIKRKIPVTLPSLLVVVPAFLQDLNTLLSIKTKLQFSFKSPGGDGLCLCPTPTNSDSQETSDPNMNENSKDYETDTTTESTTIAKATEASTVAATATKVSTVAATTAATANDNMSARAGSRAADRNKVTSNFAPPTPSMAPLTTQRNYPLAVYNSSVAGNSTQVTGIDSQRIEDLHNLFVRYQNLTPTEVNYNNPVLFNYQQNFPITQKLPAVTTSTAVTQSRTMTEATSQITVSVTPQSTTVSTVTQSSSPGSTTTKEGVLNKIAKKLDKHLPEITWLTPKIQDMLILISSITGVIALAISSTCVIMRFVKDKEYSCCSSLSSRSSSNSSVHIQMKDLKNRQRKNSTQSCDQPCHKHYSIAPTIADANLEENDENVIFIGHPIDNPEATVTVRDISNAKRKKYVRSTMNSSARATGCTILKPIGQRRVSYSSDENICRFEDLD